MTRLSEGATKKQPQPPPVNASLYDREHPDASRWLRNVGSKPIA